MNAFEIVNWVEVVFWPLLGLGCLLYGIAKRGEADWMVWMLAPVFVLFGLSDYGELQTGAWWKPLGLLLWKAASIVVFVVAGVRYYRRTKRTDGEEGRAE